MPPRARLVLQELDPSMVPMPSSLSTGLPRPNKRPHSPSVGIPDTPVKRRMKGDDGGRTPRVKSPLSGSTNSARFAPGHFHALLQGPDSPAKRLDFGSSEASEATVCEAPHSSGGGSGTPRRSPNRTLNTMRVRRSPRLSARSPGVPSQRDGFAATGQTGAEDHAATTRAPPIAPMLIPREVTSPDPQSIHYPGFDIYQDPHIILPTVFDTMSASDGNASDASSDKEYDKENVVPRRKSSKKVPAPSTPETNWVKALSPSASGKFSAKKPVPPSPHPKHVRDYLATSLSTPRTRTTHLAVSPAATLVGATPGRTPLGKEARKQMRRVMEDEVDYIDDED